jgi:1,4-dihydroxy-2-naphthoate octaprenyltransferase
MAKPSPPCIKKWITALRLPSLLLAFNTVYMGSVLAGSLGRFNFRQSLLAFLTASLLQIISNLANDYGDFVLGAEVGGRVGVADEQAIDLSLLKKAIFIVVLLAAITGWLLIHFAALPTLIYWSFITLGTIAIIAAITYTMGPKPYAYIGVIGDIAVFIFFGLIGVLGTFFLQVIDQQVNSVFSVLQYGLAPACSTGFFAVAILNLNNIRDIIIDKSVNKYTLAVRVGKQKALYYQWFLTIMGIFTLIFFTWQHYHSLWQWSFLIGCPVLVHMNHQTATLNKKGLDALLPQLVMLQLVITVLFGIGLLVSLPL